MRPQQRKTKSKCSTGYQLECFEQRLMLSAVATHAVASLTTAPIPVPQYKPHMPERPGLPPPDNGQSATPSGFTPAQIEAAYSANAITLTGGVEGDGKGQTIAIVDAYDYPTALNDLDAFDAQFDLPNPPSFKVLNQAGQSSPLPSTDPAGPGGDDWEGEEALDIEWSHAMAPEANIILIETNDETQLFAGVQTAREIPTVSVVSMSWGDAETANETSMDSTFVTPAGHIGITFAAAAGDSGIYASGTETITPNYPASSPNVVAVGGSSLTMNGTTYGGETVWGEGTNSGTDPNGGGGGGISAYEAQPEYQHFLVTQSTTARTYPDVALEADPTIGVPVYDTYDNGSAEPWSNDVGGTSLATPLFAGIMAIADQGRVLNGMGTLNGSQQTLPLLYSLPQADFHDITSGSNGYPAGVGYDLASGRGSPIASSIVAALDAPYIGFHVYNDTNYNGQQETGETGLSGVTVELETPGADGIGGADSTIVATTTTDAYGLYDFTDVATGTYYVHFVVPGGYDVAPIGTSTLASTNNTVDQNGNSGLITVTATTDDNLVNVGMYQASISIDNVSINRPHSGTAPMVFTVTVSPNDPEGVSIPYTTEDGTATLANDDYIGTSGTLVFAPGVTTETITVEALGNNIIENNVSYTVNLTIPAGFASTSTVGVGTILNSNFPAVTVSSPPAQTRLNKADLTYAFVVQLSEPAPFVVTVPYTTTDVTAVGGADYTANSGTLSFPIGSTGPQTIDVIVLPGTNPELNKTFNLTLETSTTVVLGNPSVGVGTILTNAEPSISAEPGSVTESLTGETFLPFNVDITPSLTGPVTISYATANGTAIAGTDYQPESGTLTFPAGRIQETVFVPVNQEFIPAQAKTLSFTISDPSTTILIATATATGTINYQPLAALPFSATQKAVYTDSLNQRVVVSLKGLGFGNVIFLGGVSNDTNAFEIVTNGTTPASSLTLSVAGGRQTSLSDVVVNGDIGTLSAKTVNILSTVSITGGINSLAVGFVEGSTVSIGGAGSGMIATLAFNRVLNSTITSAIAIKSLTASAYLDTTGSPTYITAPSIGTVKVKGNFGGTIKTTTVASVIVGGLFDGGGVLATGTIGSIQADGILNADFFAGVSGNLTSLPTSSADFANTKSSIGSIKVDGGVFSDSLIAGCDVGSVSVAGVGTTAGGSSFGISADHVGKIRTGKIGFSRQVLSLDNPTTMTTVGNFVIDPL